MLYYGKAILRLFFDNQALKIMMIVGLAGSLSTLIAGLVILAIGS